jgi:precorrin-6B C5,15-methyltransferase / cobalt-precorrin-6B C5,C15-methyltransferase
VVIRGEIILIHILGIGPGTSQWLPPAIEKVVNECEVLLGGERALELFPAFEGERFRIGGDLRYTVETLRDMLGQEKEVGILVSGDPGFYSLLPMIQREFPEEKLNVLPGLSSLQFAFARSGIPWQEAELLSVHGRSLSTLPLNVIKPLGILTGGENSPQKVAAYYQAYGFNPQISIGNSMSYPDEEWINTEAFELMQSDKNYSNAVMVINPENSNYGRLPQTLKAQSGFGLSDEEFIRGQVPMTKCEIRVQVLSKAKIATKDRIIDIGAGTGSLSIEAALLAQRGCVFAVEEDPKAQELILKNVEKFQVSNIRLIRGTAPEALSGIPIMDVCLIGGSHGQVEEILRRIPLVAGGRVVITAVTLETLTKGMEALKTLNYQEVDIVSIQAVRWKGIKDFHLAQALNPVFILSARKGHD